MPRDHHYFVYMLASGANGTLYVGVTNDLNRRVAEHKAGKGGAFTRRYGVTRLVWYEEHGDVGEAIHREKAIKKWSRDRKKDTIEASNPVWADLSAAMILPDL